MFPPHGPAYAYQRSKNGDQSQMSGPGFSDTTQDAVTFSTTVTDALSPRKPTGPEMTDMSDTDTGTSLKTN
jgi:hypothetical protein